MGRTQLNQAKAGLLEVPLINRMPQVGVSRAIIVSRNAKSDHLYPVVKSNGYVVYTLCRNHKSAS